MNKRVCPVNAHIRKAHVQAHAFEGMDQILIMSIILMLYSPRYPVNITFQAAAANLSYFYRVLFVKV